MTYETLETCIKLAIAIIAILLGVNTIFFVFLQKKPSSRSLITKTSSLTKSRVEIQNAVVYNPSYLKTSDFNSSSNSITPIAGIDIDNRLHLNEMMLFASRYSSSLQPGVLNTKCSYCGSVTENTLKCKSCGAPVN
jgi:hypothetical protein